MAHLDAVMAYDEKSSDFDDTINVLHFKMEIMGFVL